MSANKQSFKFLDVGTLSDGEIGLVVIEKTPGGKKNGYVPQYSFNIRLHGNPEPIGGIRLRVGSTKWVTTFGGNIGFDIKEEYQGHRYAAKACNLVMQVALAHGLKTLWIACYPDNIASRRTCEIIGCELVEIIDLPKKNRLYQPPHTQACRYRWDLGERKNDLRN